jgi:hypothetical protein
MLLLVFSTAILAVLDVSVIVVSLKLGPKLLWKQVMVVSAAALQVKLSKLMLNAEQRC